jgi:uncharacterized protein
MLTRMMGKPEGLFSTLFISGILFATNIQGQDKLYSNSFPLADVKLLEGPFRRAMNLNIKTVLKYDVDRLLAPYRKEAGLEAKASSYTNWDGLDGHIGGHYLSALAIHFAATGDRECNERLKYMISELKACQDTNSMKYPDWGVGYAGGVPKSKEIWPALKSGDFKPYRAAWVPWYNIHKTYAGLRDAWLYTGNEQAKSMFLKFCDWAINITASLSDTQLQSMLDTEHGGMPESFADAYQLTGDEKYMMAARRFSHKMLLDPMSSGQDDLDNKHANTQVPKAIGFQRIAELTHDEKYNRAAGFFWETVTKNRSLAFGGNSRREHFPAVKSATDFIDEVEGPESCNSYNMLKLTEGLFRDSFSAKYVDYYERTLFNHILSTQHPATGGYVYFTPARPRHYRVYSSPNEAMWCCVGTGMENHGKYGQFIYTHNHDSLFLNLFMASELNWRDKGIKLRQQTNFPDEEKTTLIVTEGKSRFNLMLRYPSWVKVGDLKITINGKAFPHISKPGSYISISRLWEKGDVLKVELPMRNRIEHLPNQPVYIAMMHGPILLAAKTGTEDLKGLLANASRWGHIAGGKRLPLDKAPIIVENDLSTIETKLKRVKTSPLSFTMHGVKLINPIPLVLEPFYKIHDIRYMMYWMALTNTQYHSYVDSIAAVEKQRIALQQRTVDYVLPGEQQPEADHAIQSANSNTGSHLDEMWRDAQSEGYFSYNLATGGTTHLSLIVRYWGAEWGNRKFDIYVDNEKLVTENNTGRWNQSRFHDIEYPIPESMTKGKNHIRVKFQASPLNTAGAVYHVRLVRKE